MSTTALFSLCAIVVTAATMIPLASGDPKRLRADARLTRVERAAMSSAWRRALAAVLLLPGLILIVAGQWPAFLIWMGASASVGWLIASVSAPRGGPGA